MTRGQAAGWARGYTQGRVQGYPAVHWVTSHPMAGCRAEKAWWSGTCWGDGSGPCRGHHRHHPRCLWRGCLTSQVEGSILCPPSGEGGGLGKFLTEVGGAVWSNGRQVYVEEVLVQEGVINVPVSNRVDINPASPVSSRDSFMKCWKSTKQALVLTRMMLAIVTVSNIASTVPEKSLRARHCKGIL